MCDELFSDCSCDDNCCVGMTDCCGCCSSEASNTGATSGDAAPAMEQGDNNCFYYLCCAGCFLCPLFYVGYKQQTLSPGDAIPVGENTQPLDKGNNNNDTATIAASTTTAETGTLSLASGNDTDLLPCSEPPAVETTNPMQRS